jgi:hypothetical protein
LPLKRTLALLDERFVPDALFQGKRALAIDNPDVHGFTNGPAVEPASIKCREERPGFSALARLVKEL